MPTAAQLESVIRGYFGACNSGDAARIASFFAPDAVHYFAEGSFPAMRGRDAIGEEWADCVKKLDSRWTVDRVLIDADRLEAVIEWTHFKPALGGHLRGDEWYIFDEQGKIREIRAYYACPAHPGTAIHELGGYDYAGLGYPMNAPDVERAF